MLAIDRWRNWRPGDEKLGDSHEREPSKPSEPTFEGFEGSTSEQMQTFSDATPEHGLAGWFVNGERVTVFPHCPRCASYALYRQDSTGEYECMTCGQTGIAEHEARRVQ